MFVVFDLDGTLALIEHRVHHIRSDPKDYDAFFAACKDDIPNQIVIDTLRAHRKAGHWIEIWSGRSDAVRGITQSWLDRHVTTYDCAAPLTRMRVAGDHRPDVVVKREWLNEARAGQQAPDLVYDDRDVVVAMWREEGVPCFQVAAGPF